MPQPKGNPRLFLFLKLSIFISKLNFKPELILLNSTRTKEAISRQNKDSEFSNSEKNLTGAYM